MCFRGGLRGVVPEEGQPLPVPRRKPRGGCCARQGWSDLPVLVLEEAPESDRAPAVTPVAVLLLAAKLRLVVEVDARALVARMPTSPA